MGKEVEFLELVEKIYGKPIRKAIEIQLKRHGEKIIDAIPVREAEHNWFPGDMKPKEIAKRILNGYWLTLKDKGGKERSIRFDSYMLNLLEERGKEVSVKN